MRISRHGQFHPAVHLVDERLAAFGTDSESPGTAYALLKDGEVVHLAGIGTRTLGADEQPDADTVFRIASMTKSVTASAVLRPRAAGRCASTTASTSTCPGPRRCVPRPTATRSSCATCSP